MAKAAQRIVIIGAGHNGLVTAAYLAKAGYAPLLLERRDTAGGTVGAEELAPQFRCPAVQHSLGPLMPGVIADLQLVKQGLRVNRPEVRVFAPDRNGAGVAIYEDAARTARELGAVSIRDGQKYVEFCKSFTAIGGVLSPLMSMTPPSISSPSKNELWEAGKLGLKFRRLSKKDAFRLLRWGPMAVADLVAEWFETELLRATVAARGTFGAFAGPWSAGTGAGLLMQSAFDGHAIAPALFVNGGMGELSRLLAKAATSAGAQLRTNAEVERIQTRNGKVSGVVLKSGEEIEAGIVVSNADPKRTFLGLLDPADLDPDFLLRMRNYRCLGSAAKVNLALSALPAFSGIKDAAVLGGRIHIGPDIDYMEQAFDAAKYGDFSPHPQLDITIPSLTDDSLAPKGAHVMSIHVQYAPYRLKNGDWQTRRQEFGDTVVKTLSAYAPNLHALIVNRQVLTPLDLEQQYGLTGGHLLHGEPALDQLFTFRPLLGWAQYRTPVQGLYLCGGGTHPGGGVTGAPGANAGREIINDLKSR